MLRLLGVAALSTLFCALLAQPSMGQIFTDDLSTGANWTVVQDADASAVFGFDYSTKGVPAAPRGSDTIGLKFEVNNSSPAAAASILAYHRDAAFTGQFTFRVDAWINWAPDGGGVGSGTTEFIGGSVGHDGTLGGTGVEPFGWTFLYTSEGDAAATDYRMYKEGFQAQSESGQYAAGTEAGSRDSSNEYYTTAFPSFDIASAVTGQATGTQPAGAGGFQWMTLNFEVDTENIGPSGALNDPGFVRVSMRSARSGNTIEIGVLDNSNDDVMLGIDQDTTVGMYMADLFSSVTLNPDFSFGLFDNVEVLEGLVPLDAGGLAGDFDGSGFVDGGDFVLWQSDTGVGDLGDWQSNYGMGTPPSVGAVPEPATLLLLALAAPAALARRRR